MDARPVEATNTGLIPDPRTPAAKMRDYLHEERALPVLESDPFPVMATPPITPGFPPYPYENQQGTSSCVPHGVDLALGIERKADGPGYVRLAQLFTYRLRSNFPDAGCFLQNIFDVGRKYGAPLFTSLPTTAGEGEAAANAVVLTGKLYLEGEIYKGDEYYSLETPNDIEALASIAALGHGVPILIYATYQEWAQEYPDIQVAGLVSTDPRAAVRHCICVLPNSGFTKDGKRYLTIQDSAWFGGFKMRYLSEDFIKARVFGAGYWDTVSIIGTGNYPKHVFTKTLSFGANGSEVRFLQLLLIAEGVLPSDCATGYFGGRTLAGVHAFQNKHAAEILVPLKLNAPTDTFGSMSIAVANKLCA